LYLLPKRLRLSNSLSLKQKEEGIRQAKSNVAESPECVEKKWGEVTLRLLAVLDMSSKASGFSFL